MTRHHLIHELQAHLPFSIFFTAAGIMLAALLTYVAIMGGAYPAGNAGHRCDPAEAGVPTLHPHPHEHALATAARTPDAGTAEPHDCAAHGSGIDVAARGAGDRLIWASEVMFHVLHPIHLLLSAMATTAMFFRYERRSGKAVVVGFIGSVGVCGLSDIFMPFLAGHWLAAEHMHFHWCLIAHPQVVLPFVALGILSGLAAASTVGRSTIFSHSAHVLVSCAASLFYLISYGVDDWFVAAKFPHVFGIVVLCVTIPCCLSDILFPLLIATPGAETHCRAVCDHNGHDGSNH